MRQWVVIEARVAQRVLWAWNLLGAGPGFDEVAYTAADGYTPVDAPDEPVQLGRVLFVTRAVTADRDG